MRTCENGCNGCDDCTDYSAALNDARNGELQAAQELDELRASIRQALGFAECSGGPNQMPNVVETLRRALGPNVFSTDR